NIPVVEPNRQREAAELMAGLRALPADSSTGGRLLDCIVSFHDMIRCDPRAVPRALRALSDGVLVEQANGDSPLVCGWMTLIAA
ncbi:hypothetical protein GTY86_12145, partial [Streptomyces sp. SID5770]|uniref:hypothetical protein n=1 Tax=Streptomyces sp. SID5770 TaxID=2690308 RepID=UPI00136AEF72